MAKFCTKCGTPMHGGRFCEECGYKVEAEQSPQAVPQPPQETAQPTVQMPEFPQPPVQAAPPPLTPATPPLKPATKSSKGKIIGIIIAACLVVGAAVAVFMLDPFGWRDTSGNYGNTTGNIANFGLAATDGDRIYYINADDDFRIYSVKKDGSDNQKINDTTYSFGINVLDGWIYYTDEGSDSHGLYKINTSGAMPIKLSDDEAYYINVVDDTIYYSLYFSYSSGTGGGIYRIDTDGNNKQMLSSDNSLGLNVAGDRIYYINLDDDRDRRYSDEGEIYSMKADGSDRQRVTNNTATQFNVVGNYIYYINAERGYRIHRINTDGSDDKQVSDISAVNINVNGDRIFYTSALGESLDESLHSMKTDGTDNKQLSREPSRYMCIVGDRIIFAMYDDNWDLLLYTMKTDGTDLKRLHEFTGFKPLNDYRGATGAENPDMVDDDPIAPQYEPDVEDDPSVQDSEFHWFYGTWWSFSIRGATEILFLEDGEFSIRNITNEIGRGWWGTYSIDADSLFLGREVILDLTIEDVWGTFDSEYDPFDEIDNFPYVLTITCTYDGRFLEFDFFSYNLKFEKFDY